MKDWKNDYRQIVMSLAPNIIDLLISCEKFASDILSSFLVVNLPIEIELRSIMSF